MASKAFNKLNLRPWFVVSIIFLYMFVLLMYCLNQSTCQTYLLSTVKKHTTNFTSSNQCPLGRVFVYDMPPEFNRELIEKCDELNPWISRCNAFLNEGFGDKATNLAGLVPKNLIPAWYWTDQYTLDVIFHNRILNYKCRTTEAESAAGFFIPFYVGHAVAKYMWKNTTERDRHCGMMLKWVQEQPYWSRSNGSDHLIIIGYPTWDFRRLTPDGWGSSCIYMPGMQNITRFLTEGDPLDYLDVSVPYPTGFHPRSDSEIHQWQNYARHRRRSFLFCFVGGPRDTIKNDFRAVLLNYCKNESDSCRLADCSRHPCINGTSAVLETLLDSDFCLQPRGETMTRRSMFDCMIAGSIPVFLWEGTTHLQYPWHLPVDPRSYSVFIDHNEVRNESSIIKAVLRRYSEAEVRKLRETVIDLIPKLLYAKPKQGLGTLKDAFDVAIDELLRRFKEQKQRGYKLVN